MGRLQNNPSIRWVHPKSTHAHPLAWGNKKRTQKKEKKKEKEILVMSIGCQDVTRNL
jgi:hypothetical protein